ncbi:MAG: hypothetical protein J2P25_16005 [Nocardiopsaceae bacterium]|nr:hypothetical protein [Nocardiopsaceae bacterium]
MNAAQTLEPRVAGTETVEPVADFGGTVSELHERTRCAASEVCGNTATTACINTQ